MSRAVAFWLALGMAGFALMPWYFADGGGPLSFLLGLFDEGVIEAERASGLIQALILGRWWLLPPGLLLLTLSVMLWRMRHDAVATARWMIILGLSGIAYIFIQGFLIKHRGWVSPWLGEISGLPEAMQPGMGYGALCTLAAFLVVLCYGLARRGACRGDGFVTAAIGGIVLLIAIFVFYPVFKVLISALQNNEGGFAPGEFWAKLTESSIWGLDCISGALRCGVAWNTLFLGLFVAAATTFLGLVFALLQVRTGFRHKYLYKSIAILPIITPPFVIGLAIILLFGRSGWITLILDQWLGIAPSRWIYSAYGVALAQILAFTPISFLVLSGVVQGISPSLEEAAQTLRAKNWRTLATVSWPLVRPGIANAFLLSFVESMADFGNPLVLGGNFEVLSTKIFFAVVGAAHDQSRAAVLAFVLLAFTLTVFYAQRRWLGKKLYTTITGKGDSGLPMALPVTLRAGCYAIAFPWMTLTLAIYVTIFLGGFVRLVGHDYGFTFEYYLTAFGIDSGNHGLVLTGSAWDSLITTLKIAAISAPLTALVGLVTAYLLTRQRFWGQRAFEFGTLLSFAIPGTVIGIGYILAFNVPPIELTGTGAILVICFIFRNMPVGVRSGIAALSQIDKSLDEASLTLGAGAARTLRRVVLPLIKPAIVTSLVYSFVRAMTSVSAVIFLVSAEYNMATAYIVGRVENGEYGLGIAYASVLIVIMLFAIVAIQFIVGERKLGRRAASATAKLRPAASLTS